jgi:hypothetical protein
VEPRLSPVERALRRVERALDEGRPAQQREALEALAAELDGDGRAARARSLAWRPEPPPADAATALVAELRGADGTAG